jgi:acyl-coenzyme A synthetase/AMP-(fatty) acid ligase
MNLDDVIQYGISLKTSGTSGDQKYIYQSPSKIYNASKVAIDCQKITRSSKILTICNPAHAAGLLAQTLPAYIVGAEFRLVSFNAYSFFKNVSGFTHTMATPLHLKLIMSTKQFKDCNLSGLFILTGADPVEWYLIEEFVKKGATVCSNWGMTEIGPICINKTFYNIDQVLEEKNKSNKNTTILGDTFYCDYKIVNDELFVKGDICVYDDWYGTKDLVSNVNDTLYYHGRKDLHINLNESKKGL